MLGTSLIGVIVNETVARLMINLSKKYKMYSWETNYGYPTLKHKEAIESNGITEYHRKSFKLI